MLSFCAPRVDSALHIVSPLNFTLMIAKSVFYNGSDREENARNPCHDFVPDRLAQSLRLSYTPSMSPVPTMLQSPLVPGRSGNVKVRRIPHSLK